ncbi:MAG: tetratricopeptide repeat protein, partial [Spirochaetes bacterium]|nr:tetratricopeptide repeat protein [Spirochaetota bacterium]
MIKYCLLIFFLFFSFVVLKSNDLETGIQHYREKKSIEAKYFLEKAVTSDKTGKAYYYLGNVLMNLHEYDKAISYYTNSYDMKYEKINCLYNIACAYSLKSDNYYCLIYLLLSTQKSVEIQYRVIKDKDLTTFRNSKEYNEYKILKNYPIKGIVPKTEKDLRDYLFLNSGIYGIDTPNQDGFFHFYPDGSFFFKDGGGFIPTINTGTWKIDETRKILLITLLGDCQSIEFIKATQSISEQTEYFKRGIFISNNKQYVWHNKLSNPIVDEIDFKDIELNIK